MVSREFVVKINVDELDFRNYIKPSSYLQYFQDLTALHFLELGIDHVNMIKRNKFWILSRMTVEIDKPIFALSGEEIRVVTKMRRPKNAETLRDFYVYKNGQLCVRAVSRWCVLDLDTKRICRCGEHIPVPDEEYSDEFAVDPSVARANLKIPENAVASRAENLWVRHSDLDYNRHMNNARYADVVFNACDFEQLNLRSIKGFDIHFISELMPDAQFLLRRVDLGDYSLFEATNFVSQKKVFCAKITWGVVTDEPSIK